jgi:hypothetical protein
MILKVTSGGNEIGSRPIRDAHSGVVENGRALEVQEAGLSKSGSPRKDLRNSCDD